MLSIRDQENLVHGHQQAALSKPLNQNTRAVQPKTPGNKYPKTPLKLPHNDENAPTGFGGRSVLKNKGKGAENLVVGGKNGAISDNNAFVTPLGPRSRAPLGMKTTNAKAKAFQTPGHPAADKEVEKTQAKQTSTRRLKPKVSPANTVKLNIHDDERDPLEEREVEYAPPRPKYPGYESEDFPAGSLNYRMLEGPNLMRGFDKHYLNPVDENGISIIEKKFDEELQRAYKDTDERVLKAIEDEEWTVSDVPETFKASRTTSHDQDKSKAEVEVHRGPLTIASRKAASALSVIPKPATTNNKVMRPAAVPKTGTSFLSSRKAGPAPPVSSSEMRHTAATAASRSTIGYNKGRNTSGVLKMGPRGLPRTASNLSAGSDATITPARYAHKDVGSKDDGWKRLKFLGAFDVDDEDIEPSLRGVLPECLRRDEDDEEEFVLELGTV